MLFLPDSLRSYTTWVFPDHFFHNVNLSYKSCFHFPSCISILDEVSHHKVAMPFSCDIFPSFLFLFLHLSGIEFPVRGSFFFDSVNQCKKRSKTILIRICLLLQLSNPHSKAPYLPLCVQNKNEARPDKEIQGFYRTKISILLHLRNNFISGKACNSLLTF